MRSLNSDIFLSIIDQLHNDKSTLATSSLVSRSWLSACRPHLFSTLRVYGYDPESGTVEIDSFGEFLDNSPSLCGHVRHLEIQARKSQLPASNFGFIPITWAADIPPPLSLSTCFTIISKLPNLLEFTLANAALIAEGDFLRGSFPSVVGLEISNIHIPHSSSVWDIIRPFCYLRSLRMVNFNVPPWSETQATFHPFPKLPLRHLTLSGIDQVTVLRTLLKMQCLLSIVSLNVDAGWIAVFEALNDVLMQYGGQIVDLTVHPFEAHNPTAIMMNLCSQLRSITFTVAIFTHQPELDNGTPWNAVIRSLLMIPSALRRVVINTDVYGDVDGGIGELGECVDWEGLDRALESHRSLEAVVLRIAGVDPRAVASCEELERFKCLVGSHLARASTRGILQLTVPVD